MSVSLTMASNGRIVIPASMRTALGLPEGGRMIARLVEGAIVLEAAPVAVRRAQAMVRRYVPDGISLSAELLADRRATAADE